MEQTYFVRMNNINGKCVVCGRYSRGGLPKLSLFSFPYKRRPELSQRWIDAMQLSSVKKFGKICHHHFEPSAIANDKFTFKQTLVRDAVPTILIVETDLPIIKRKETITPRVISFEEFYKLECKYKLLKQKYAQKINETRVLRQRLKRMETLNRNSLSEHESDDEILKEVSFDEASDDSYQGTFTPSTVLESHIEFTDEIPQTLSMLIERDTLDTEFEEEYIDALNTAPYETVPSSTSTLHQQIFITSIKNEINHDHVDVEFIDPETIIPVTFIMNSQTRLCAKTNN